MIIPNHLQPGDKISIVCTARFVEKSDINEAIHLAESWGLKVVLGSSIGLKHHQFGGTDIERLQDLQNQINNPQIKAIWCARGGYGTARILDNIDCKPLLKHSKWIIGYSDITALHLYIQHFGLCSLHAQMPVDLASKSDKTIESLKMSLFVKPCNIQYTSKFNSQNGYAKGTLIGGNLSVLYSVLGTKNLPDFSDKILFIEDIDEYLYHIDRMMLNLSRNGVLQQLKGIIVGSMTKMNDNNIPFGKSAQEIIAHYTNRLNIPIAYDCPVGHGFENLCLTLGAEIRLHVDENKISIEY